MQLAVERANRLWILKLGADEHHSTCAPGIVLTHETIRWAFEHGLAGYELLGDDAPWTRAWTDQVHPYAIVRTYPLGVRAVRAAVGDVAAQARKRASPRRGVTAIATVRSRVIATLGRGYIAGSGLADAMRVGESEAAAGARLTLGAWIAADDPPDEALARHRDAVAAIAASGLPATVSVKLPDLDFDETRLAALLTWATAHQVSIHLDSMRPGTAAPTFERLREVVADHPTIGCTLPGRWPRSVADAERVVEMGVRSVRVVKGQWADPDDPDRDPASGVLEVIDALQGSGAEVGVATHDEPLAYEALDRLVSTNTPTRLEQLYGLPRLDVAAVRRRFGVDHLVYVPYGEAYLGYALTQALRNPRILTWAARDLIGRRGSLARGSS